MFSKKNYWLLECILITLYLVVGFVPYFRAVDKIAPQFVYISALNFFGSIYLIFTVKHISFNKASLPIISFVVLTIWSFCSLFYAINNSEVLIESSRTVNFLFSFIILYTLVKRNKHLLKYAPYLISIILFIELAYVYERFFKLFDAQNFSRTMALRGFSGNINITAFSFLLKLPFFLITISRLKVNFVLKSLVLVVFTFGLFLLGSRGANLTFFLSTFLSFVFAYTLKENSFFLKKSVPIFLFSIIIGITINSILFKSEASLNVLQRSTSLNNESTNQRLRFYKAAIQSIMQNPVLGIGIGNWKIHSIEYDKPFMEDYKVPYHVHNDYLEFIAELGIIGFILFFGIFVWLFFLIFSSIKSREYLKTDMFYLVTACSISLIVYLADSFLNFPYTRPLMQIQNLFYMSIVLVVLNDIELPKFKLNFKINLDKNSKKIVLLALALSGLSFSSFISYKVYKSFVEQQFLMAAGNGTFTNYSKEYVESISSDIPSITATTIPIETFKANLIFNLDLENYEDTLHYMIDQGKKQNPFLPYNELTKSILLIKQLEPESAYIYAKQAFYEIPNHTQHFNLLMDIAEAFKDSLEVEKAMKRFEGKQMRDYFYDKYLEVSLNIKNNIGLTESKILEAYSSRNKDSDRLKGYNAIFEVGLKGVEDGYLESLKAEKYFREKEFEKAAESFIKSYEFNPTEVSYYENAANAYMQMGEDQKAIQILKDVILKLNPTTGKAEYLLAIIYIGQEKNNIGCDYLYKSKQKGFSFPNFMIDKFCLN